MADSTMVDVTKLKVVDLRKELKTRGLSYAGDKAELVARLQAALSQDDHGDINLDSDEIDSDGVLEDEDDKNQTDILDDSAVDTLNEELALSEQTHVVKPNSEAKPQRTLKRKLTVGSESSKENSDDCKPTEHKEIVAKKIVLNRAVSFTASGSSERVETKESEENSNKLTDNKVKITADLDTKTRLELRAKRFGLPVKISEDERKEARKQRFGQGDSKPLTHISAAPTGSLSENMEKLRKRAERFGQSVSKIMTDIENKERLEKRKAKFGGIV